MDPKKRRTWLSIVIAAVIIVGVLAVVVVGGTALFFFRHINTQFTPQENADAQFAQARARFAGQKPLIEIRKDDDPIFHRELLAEATSTKKLDSVRVLAYDPRARKLVRVTIPFWLIRLAPSGGNFSFSDDGIDFDTEKMRLTAEDLERRGPGLILDAQDRRGSLVIVWTE